jgi:hypothetical protein
MSTVIPLDLESGMNRLIWPTALDWPTKMYFIGAEEERDLIHEH